MLNTEVSKRIYRVFTMTWVMWSKVKGHRGHFVKNCSCSMYFILFE